MSTEPSPAPVASSSSVSSPNVAAASTTAPAPPLPDKVDCIIAGGGPAGLFLALLLARQGVSVALLEAHADFDRDFRGDTIHPSTMEVLDQLGLAERILAMNPGKLRDLTFISGDDHLTLASFPRTGGKFKFPYIAILPQVKMLNLLADEAKKFESFHLLMGASVNGLLYNSGGIVNGVTYRQGGVDKELRARLVVGADGRASRIRKEADLEMVRTSVPMDVVWFRIPQPKGMTEDGSAAIRFGPGRVLVVLDRGEDLQIGAIVPKKGYADLRRTGIEAFLESCVKIYPVLEETIGAIKSWKDVALLSVECGHLTTWHRPGVLCIGDAAHIMSPVGGVGINYAVQDAVAAANILTEPLLDGSINEIALVAVQSRRERPALFMQGIQSMIHKRILASALDSSYSLPIPGPLRLLPYIPILRDYPTRIVGYGILPETVHHVHVRGH